MKIWPMSTELILEEILLTENIIIRDLASCFAAHRFFLTDPNRAKELILSTKPENLSQLSVNSLISYHRLRGVIFERLQDYSLSLSEYLCAVSLMKTIANITPELALSYSGIGNIYSLTNQHNRAITAFSFAASLFNFLSLEKQKQSMLNNISLIRTIKAKNYLTTGIISLNDEKYSVASEYLEKAMNEFSLIIIDTDKNELLSVVEEIKHILEPIMIRFLTDTSIEQNLHVTSSNFKILDSSLVSILKEKQITQQTLNILNSISVPLRTVIYQFILIYHDGRMITSTKSTEAMISQGQDMIFAGAITAIQMLLKETLHTEKVHTIDAGETKILLRKGELAQTIVVANKITDKIVENTDHFMNSFETEYKSKLMDWNGSMVDLKGAKSMLEEMIMKKSTD